MDDYTIQVQTVEILKWGHLIQFITQVAILYLKRYENYELANFLSVTVSIFAVFFPLIKALYTFRFYNFEDIDDHVEKTMATIWIIIELQYWMTWFFSLMFFIFCANILGYNSIRKKALDKSSMYLKNN